MMTVCADDGNVPAPRVERPRASPSPHPARRSTALFPKYRPAFPSVCPPRLPTEAFIAVTPTVALALAQVVAIFKSALQSIKQATTESGFARLTNPRRRGFSVSVTVRRARWRGPHRGIVQYCRRSLVPRCVSAATGGAIVGRIIPIVNNIFVHIYIHIYIFIYIYIYTANITSSR
jgi:hypothetical protein